MNTEILIDCYGRSYIDEIHLAVKGVNFGFIFNPDKKIGKLFSLAMYLDHAVSEKEWARYSVDRRICLLLESPIYDFIGDKKKFDARFRRIFTHRKSLLESSEKYIPLYYGTSWLEGHLEGRGYDKSELVSFIGSIEHCAEHGYPLRMDVAQVCMGLEAVDCYGKGIRPIDSKISGLEKYAFSIAMENIREDYYFSEKLIDCLLTDTVPIYWGCPGIVELFDERGMITFQTLEDLERILSSLSMEKYREMLPYVRNNRAIAVKNNWCSLKGIYTRLGSALVEQSLVNDLHPVKPRRAFTAAFHRLLASELAGL